MRRLIIAPALAAALCLPLAACGDEGNDISVGAGSASSSSSSSSSSTSSSESSSSEAASSTSTSSSSSTSSETSGSSTSSSSSPTASAPATSKGPVPPAAQFKPAAGADKQGILATARAFATAIGKNDMKAACRQVAGPDGTPVKDDALLMPECEKEFKKSLGGTTDEQKKIRLVYSKMTFDKATQAGSYGLAWPKLYGKQSDKHLGLVKTGSTWYIDTNRVQG